MNKVLEVIKSRRSIRTFRDGQVKDHELAAILEAAQYAPNAGSQSWQFIALQKKELIDEISAAAKEAAKNHAIPFLRQLANDPGYHCFYDAPTVILVCGDESPWAPYDCAAATQNILLAAESLGVASCWIYFGLLAFEGEKAPHLRERLSIREEYKPLCSVALGNRRGPVPDPAPRKKDTVTYIK
jgi:nitroreductase